MNASPSTIAVRAYATSVNAKPRRPSEGGKDIGYSQWSLTFDTETTTDHTQQLRFGCYGLRKVGVLKECGFFYDSQTLKKGEVNLLSAYAEAKGYELREVREFVDKIFYPYLFSLNALCVGFNLPFDISRLAIGHGNAKGKMLGGFSFILSGNTFLPRVTVKHLDSRAALIQFNKPYRQITTRSMRRDGIKVEPNRGYFLDVKTLASALLSKSWSLGLLAEHLKTEHQKLCTDEHGGELTEEYIRYAMQDVQVTWECFEKLRDLYEGYGLTESPVNRIYSEAGLGKAYLKQMGVRPWRELQPDFPPELLGAIMSTYYGGRSEIHIRRQAVRVFYCDFHSMYPTVCTLMRLWKFVISQGVEWQDVTTEVGKYLKRIEVSDLQNSEEWKRLTTIVQILPDEDVLPVRAKYNGSSYSIGVNYLSSDRPLWYTLADCITSKLLTGKPPKIVKALRFNPIETQEGLRPISIAGNKTYGIDPLNDDFYKRLIDLRSEVKAKQKGGDAAASQLLEVEQLALKICANATSYGIFVEINPTEFKTKQRVTCYGPSAEPFQVSVKNVEEPGKFFHPLLATLITGAARLMLAITEKLAADRGVSWAMCDTDSMALAKPDGMSEAQFLDKCGEVTEWFTGLNPYKVKGSIFKVEEVNYVLHTKEVVPLYCWAISTKRYALFNIRNGSPVIRKASAHGLGHLREPYGDGNPSTGNSGPFVSLNEIGVKRWQYDLWHLIIRAGLGNKPAVVPFDTLDGFEKPAVSRYSATSPALLKWYSILNEGKSYCKQVKPFNFLLSFQYNNLRASKTIHRSEPKPVAPFDPDHVKALELCFDREGSEPMAVSELKTYRELLLTYHLHPEDKFEGGDYVDSGVTRRSHVVASRTEQIGKEANRWEEQLFLGCDPEAQVVYCMTAEGRMTLTSSLIRECRRYSRRTLSRASGISLRQVSRILTGRLALTEKSADRLRSGIIKLKTQVH